MFEAFRLDEAMILERLGGDEEILLMMIDMFTQDIDTYCLGLDNALQAGDAALLQREAHTVKGLLASFGDDPGTEAAYALESSAREGRLTGLAAPIAELQTRLREVGAILGQRGG